MGTDDLFHKRTKLATSLDRRKHRREPYAKVLIVCEGEKTEPYYFEDLKNYYGLNSANIDICGECASDPVGIVKYANQRYREARDARDPFDRVYCVFDKDTHDGYVRAVDQIGQAKPKDVFVAITSVPCFEFWLLLHYVYSTKPYIGQHGNSSCSQLIADLNGYLNGYSKGRHGTFSELVDQLDFAKENAVRSLREAQANHTDNPSTRVHELVDFLQHIKDRT